MSLAWPASATGIVRIAMRTVDLIIVGAVVGAAGVAAVGIADTAARVVVLTSLGLAAGTVASVSQAYGAGDHEGVEVATTQTVVLACLLGGVATAVGILGAPAFFRLLGAGPDVAGPGADYLRIVMATAVPRVLSILAARAIQATGDTRTPMVVRVVGTGVNIGLTVLLVAGLGPFPRLGVVGAGIGTAVGNLLSGAALFAVLASGRHPRLRLRATGWRRFDIGRRIARIGSPQVLERNLFAFAAIPLNALVLTFGTAANAGFNVGRRVLLLALMPALGMGVAGSHLVGMRVGQRDADAASAEGDRALILTAGISVCSAALALAFAGPIAAVFAGGEPAAAAEIVPWVRAFAVAAPLRGVYAVGRGVMQGAGETRLPLYASAVGVIVMLLGGATLTTLVLGWGIVGIYGAVIADPLVRTALLLRWWRAGTWRR
ncbi:MAG: MATE family efflux transporter, partial [Haloechinothrix sp.]